MIDGIRLIRLPNGVNYLHAGDLAQMVHACGAAAQDEGFTEAAAAFSSLAEMIPQMCDEAERRAA